MCREYGSSKRRGKTATKQKSRARLVTPPLSQCRLAFRHRFINLIWVDLYVSRVHLGLALAESGTLVHLPLCSRRVPCLEDVALQLWSTQSALNCLPVDRASPIPVCPALMRVSHEPFPLAGQDMHCSQPRISVPELWRTRLTSWSSPLGSEPGPEPGPDCRLVLISSRSCRRKCAHPTTEQHMVLGIGPVLRVIGQLSGMFWGARLERCFLVRGTDSSADLSAIVTLNGSFPRWGCLSTALNVVSCPMAKECQTFRRMIGLYSSLTFWARKEKFALRDFR